MANIDIQRKGPTIWPWLIGLLAVVVVVWIWAAAADDTDDTDQPIAVAPPPGAAPAGTTGTTPGTTGATPGTADAPGGAISDYLEFAGAPGLPAGTPEMGKDHEYTAEGIRKLGAALQDLVERRPGVESQQRLDRFRESAQKIQQDPTSAGHADRVREVFTTAADVVASVEAGAGDTLRQAATAIDGSTPLLEQREQVRTFFRQSAEAIQRLAMTS